MQIEIQQMFLDFMKQVNCVLEANTEDKRKCFVFLHKAQNAAMKAIENYSSVSQETI